MKRTFMSALVLLLALSISTPGLAQGPKPPGQSSEQVLSVELPPGKEKAVLDLWTREAIVAAQPMEMPVQSGQDAVDEAALSAPAVTDPVETVAPSAQAPDADLAAKAAYPEDWAALEEAGELPADEPTGTFGVYDAYTLNAYSPLQRIYPHKWVGRLSFTTPSGTSFCSASVLRGNNIVTAAHCVYDTQNNRFYSNWVFTPAYRAGNAPYGTFPFRACTVLAAWVNLSGSYSINTFARWDVAVCTMGPNSAGTTLNSAVGSAGRAWNTSYIRHFYNMGYPFRDFNLNLLPSAGAYLRTCVAESFQRATEVRGMGCEYGPGISGGPWLTSYKVNVLSGFVEGVNSGLVVGQRNAYGGRFNSTNIVPLCNTRGC